VTSIMVLDDIDRRVLSILQAAEEPLEFQDIMHHFNKNVKWIFMDVWQTIADFMNHGILDAEMDLKGNTYYRLNILHKMAYLDEDLLSL
jgi:hypothetical protein